MDEARTARQRFQAPNHTMKEHHMAATILTAERLREVLDYNPDTGVFVWKVRTSNRVHIGMTANRSHPAGYLQTRIDCKSYLNHRLAWLYTYGAWPNGDIDHINGFRSDNRIGNLRDVARNINLQNQRHARSDNKASGLLGVSRNKKRWKARLVIDRKEFHIGTFDTPEEAHAAYIEAKRRLHPGCTI